MKIGIRKDIRIIHWIYATLTVLGTIFFVLWTGYYLTLLFIPFFIDAYITKILPWSRWKETNNKSLAFIYDWIDAIVFALIGLWFINNFFVQNYQIPTSSLEKSLLVGDFLCVSKISYGGRSPMTPLTLPLTHNILPNGSKSYLEKPSLDYKRFTGTGTIKRNDIVVFNYPAGDTVAMKRQAEDYHRIILMEGREQVWNNPNLYGEIIYRPVDKRDNYVKRCVGLPDEKIRLSNDSVFVNGVHVKGSDNEQHKYMVQTDGTVISDNLWDELNISKADQAHIYMEDVSQADSTVIERLNLTYRDGTAGRLYYNVFLTQKNLDKLKEKSFVRSAMKLNAYYKLRGEIEKRKHLQIVFPLNGEQKTEYGDFPELWLPKKGAVLDFSTDTNYKVAAYERAIKNYEGNDFKYADGKVYINGEQATSYTFKFDYYFMMGDNRDNSADSRSWGYVPEDHIAGKPLFVWLSLDPDKGWFEGKVRWNRLFTTGNKP